MRKKLTLSEAKINLQELKNAYIKEGIDLTDIKISYRNHEKARRFMRRNKNNPSHPNYQEFQILHDSTLQNFRRHRNIINLEQKIKKLEKETVTQPETNIVDVNTNVRTEQHQPQEEITANQDQTFVCNVVDELEENNEIQFQNQFEDINNDNDDNDDNDNHDTYEIDDHCHNCKRIEIEDTTTESPYYNLHLRSISSDVIRRQGKFKHIKKSTQKRNHRCNHFTVCKHCYKYLVEKDNDHKNLWPSFLWRLLSGSYKTKFDGIYNFFDVYDDGFLWKFIPYSMRHWWLRETKSIIGSPYNRNPYNDITLNHPPPIFEDKTTSYCKFIEDYDSGDLSRVVDAMNNIDIINNNILCPWSCSTNFQESGRLAFDLMVQKM